jgi:hypothetical protein
VNGKKNSTASDALVADLPERWLTLTADLTATENLVNMSPLHSQRLDPKWHEEAQLDLGITLSGDHVFRVQRQLSRSGCAGFQLVA